MRHELTQRLGLSWRESPTPGVYEIAGVPFELMRELSKRRVAIEETMAQIGEHSASAAQIAALAARPPKDHQLDRAPSLHDGWRALASERGFGAAEIAEVLDAPRTPEIDAATVKATAARLVGPEGLTQRESVFAEQAVVREWAQAAVDGATLSELDVLARELLTDAEVVQLPAAGTLGPDATVDPSVKLAAAAAPHDDYEGGARRSGADGSAVVLSRARYTTRELLGLERDLLARAQAGVASGAGVCAAAGVEQVLEGAPSASVEQAQMVRALTQRGDRVAVVRAPAGAGKTWTLNLARQAWQQEGITVLGVALSRRAAIELGEQAQLHYATSIAKLQLDVEHEGGLPAGAVLVVDEAAMVGTRTLHQLLQLVNDADGKLVLVGDEHQLPEIDAGGAFAALAERLDTIELTDNFRQQDPLERIRVQALRHGATDTYLATGMRVGRIVLGADAEQTRQLLLADWHHDWQISRPGEAVMIARVNADVAWLNDAARELRKQHGELQGPELVIAGRGFALGDLVIARRNLPGAAISNGTRGEVIALDHERARVTVRTLDDREQIITLETDYLQQRHLHHAYALTSHLAQGMTVDRTRILGPDRGGREWSYSTATRHRISSHIYLTAPDALRLDVTPTDRDPLARITRALGQQTAKQLALETTIDPTAAQTPTDELRARRDALVELLHTYPTKGAEQIEFHSRQLVEADHALAHATDEVTTLEQRLGIAARPEHADLHAAIERAQSIAGAWRREREEHRHALTQLSPDEHPDRWLERNAPAVRELAQIETLLHHREPNELRTQIAVAMITPDAEIAARLGGRPFDQAVARAWDRSVCAIVAYRYHHPELASPLTSPEPAEPTSRHRWNNVHDALHERERIPEPTVAPELEL